MSTPSKLIRSQDHPIVGLIAAELVLLLLFAITLLVDGVRHFEWGLALSSVLWLAVVAGGYLIGAAVVGGGSWVLRRSGYHVRDAYTLLGVSLVLLMWLCTEVPPLSTMRAKFVGEFASLSLCVLLSSLLALVLGLARRR